MRAVVTCCIFLALLSGIKCQQCSTSADLGITACVLLMSPPYSDYQWATCLTDEYIRERSSDTQYCYISGSVQCWYQCQLEMYELASGDVYDSCRCNPGDPVPTMPDLDPECFSPNGESCTWYRECLEAQHPCEGTDDGYAIEFAEKFCNLYTNELESFSVNGQHWIDGVRKCLQVRLVPFLRPYMEPTCADIRNEAFQSHSRCYLEPDLGAPSICDLPVTDCLRIFWLVFRNSEFRSTAFAETGKQMLEVAYGCTEQVGINKVKITRTVTFAVSAGLPFSQVRKAIAVGKFLAESLDFVSKGIGWFPFGNNSDNSRQRRQQTTVDDSKDDHVMLLVVSLDSLGIPTDSVGRDYSVDEIVGEMADAVRNGQLSKIPISVDGQEAFVGVDSIGECEDLLCSNGTMVTTLATSGCSALHLFTVLHAILCFLTAFMFW